MRNFHFPFLDSMRYIFKRKPEFCLSQADSNKNLKKKINPNHTWKLAVQVLKFRKDGSIVWSCASINNSRLSRQFTFDKNQLHIAKTIEYNL